MQLESMYQDIILDHHRNPHHKGLRDPFDAEVHHVNPVCGDEVALFNEVLLAAIAFDLSWVYAAQHEVIGTR